MWYPASSQKPGSSRSMKRSSRTHLALFQKYRCGTSRRAGPPCSGSSGSPADVWKTPALPSVTSPSGTVGVWVPRVPVLERQVRRVVAVAVAGDVLGLRAHAVEQRVDGDAGPRRAELRPLG